MQSDLIEGLHRDEWGLRESAKDGLLDELELTRAVAMLAARLSATRLAHPAPFTDFEIEAARIQKECWPDAEETILAEAILRVHGHGPDRGAASRCCECSGPLECMACGEPQPCGEAAHPAPEVPAEVVAAAEQVASDANSLGCFALAGMADRMARFILSLDHSRDPHSGAAGPA